MRLNKDQKKKVRRIYKKNDGLSDDLVKSLADKYQCHRTDIVLCAPRFTKSIVKKIIGSNYYFKSPFGGRSEEELPNKILKYIWENGRIKIEDGEYGIGIILLHHMENVAKNPKIKDRNDRYNQAQRYLSSAYEDVGDFEKSDYYYRKLKRFYGVGRHHVIKGNLEKAVIYYKKDRDDGEFDVNFKHLARVYFLKNDYEKMLETYDEKCGNNNNFNRLAKKDMIMAMKGLIDLYGIDMDKKKIHSKYPNLFDMLIYKSDGIDELIEKAQKKSKQKLDDFAKKSADMDHDPEKYNWTIDNNELEDILCRDIKGMLDYYQPDIKYFKE